MAKRRAPLELAGMKTQKKLGQVLRVHGDRYTNASLFSIRPDKRRSQLNPLTDRDPQQGGGSCAVKSTSRD